MTKFSYTSSRFISLISSSLFASVLLLYPLTGTGAENSDEEIIINADHMRLNVQSGMSIYTGNVKISQGKLILSGDEIIVQQKDNVIQHITINGKPARYNNTTETGETINAESEKMIYSIDQNKLEMTTNASLQQPNHRVSSQKIVYDTKKKVIIAGDQNSPIKSPTNTDTNRVSITLTPKKSDPEK